LRAGRRPRWSRAALTASASSAGSLEALPAGDYVVAVGALHLYGEDNLPAMLQPQG